MRHKTQEVKSYITKYKVFDKSLRSVIFRTEDLYEAVQFATKISNVKVWNLPKISFTLKTERPYVRGSWIKFEYIPASVMVILTEFGDVITEDQVLNARRTKPRYKYSGEWWAHKDHKNSRLVCTKKSAKKIKKVYTKTYRGFSLWGQYYENRIPLYLRHPKTHGEIKQACAHVDEYGEQIVKAKRRWKNVPDAWDDYSLNIYKTEKSWKHNSKRCKQWVPK